MADPLRRALCAGLLATGVLPAPARAEPGVSEREIVLGQIIDLSGPLAGITPDIVHGSRAWFDRVNARGGIHGRHVRLVTLDDGYVPANSVAAARRLIEEDQAFALLNMTGTGNVAAVLPLLAAQQPPVPLFGPITGADSLRGPELGHVFHIRASYADEAEKIVQHLVTLGIDRIAVAWLDNGFGKDGLAGVEKAMRKRALKIHSSAAIRPDAADVEQAVAALHDSRPEVIVLITTGRATVEFIKKYNARGLGMRFYALSVMGTHSTLKALGPDGVGVVVTSVVPFPWNHAHPAAREYREAMKQAGFEGISFGGFESFLNAKAMTEGLRRAGRHLTRARFVAALEGMRRLDLGGFEVGYGKGNRQGSRFVELTIIGPGERFTK